MVENPNGGYKDRASMREDPPWNSQAPALDPVPNNAASTAASILGFSKLSKACVAVCSGVRTPRRTGNTGVAKGLNELVDNAAAERANANADPQNLVGHWIDATKDPSAVNEIRCGSILWHTGEESELAVQTGTQIVTVVNGQSSVAQLEADDCPPGTSPAERRRAQRLRWDDGDVWIRVGDPYSPSSSVPELQQVPRQEQSDSRRASDASFSGQPNQNTEVSFSVKNNDIHNSRKSAPPAVFHQGQQQQNFQLGAPSSETSFRTTKVRVLYDDRPASTTWLALDKDLLWFCRNAVFSAEELLLRGAQSAVRLTGAEVSVDHNGVTVRNLEMPAPPSVTFQFDSASDTQLWANALHRAATGADEAAGSGTVPVSSGSGAAPSPGPTMSSPAGPPRMGQPMGHAMPVSAQCAGPSDVGPMPSRLSLPTSAHMASDLKQRPLREQSPADLMPPQTTQMHRLGQAPVPGGPGGLARTDSREDSRQDWRPDSGGGSRSGSRRPSKEEEGYPVPILPPSADETALRSAIQEQMTHLAHQQNPPQQDQARSSIPAGGVHRQVSPRSSGAGVNNSGMGGNPGLQQPLGYSNQSQAYQAPLNNSQSPRSNQVQYQYPAPTDPRGSCALPANQSPHGSQIQTPRSEQVQSAVPLAAVSPTPSERPMSKSALMGYGQDEYDEVPRSAHSQQYQPQPRTQGSAHFGQAQPYHHHEEARYQYPSHHMQQPQQPQQMMSQHQLPQHPPQHQQWPTSSNPSPSLAQQVAQQLTEASPQSRLSTSMAQQLTDAARSPMGQQPCLQPTNSGRLLMGSAAHELTQAARSPGYGQQQQQQQQQGDRQALLSEKLAEAQKRLDSIQKTMVPYSNA